MTAPAWPLVVVGDDGIRPAGAPNACFYCKATIGAPHAADCVIVTKLVSLRYTIIVDVRVPHAWSADDIESHRNGSPWCAGNAIEEIQKHQTDDCCLCPRFFAEFDAVLDATPHRKVRE